MARAPRGVGRPRAWKPPTRGSDAPRGTAATAGRFSPGGPKQEITVLDRIPSGVGRALRGVRAGFEKIVSEQPAFEGVPDILALQSHAFKDGGSIPPRYTADGEKLSPPLLWTDVPRGTEGLAMIVEDPDAPSPEPLVHLLVWDLPPDLNVLPEGEFKSPHHGGLDFAIGMLLSAFVAAVAGRIGGQRNEDMHLATVRR
jgi:hypothetical protein